MAAIYDVRLELVENGTRSAARVTYSIGGSHHDIEQKRPYDEVVELIGVDEGPGEDGQNNRLVGGRIYRGSVVFTAIHPIDRVHLFPLPTSVLDEDRSTSPVAGPPLEDEIRARVSLSAGPIIGESNLVKRGGPVLAGAPAPT